MAVDLTRGLIDLVPVPGDAPIHVYRPDDGVLYCHRLRAEVTLTQLTDTEECQTCPFYEGTVQGEGRECQWNEEDVAEEMDRRPEAADDDEPEEPEEPEEE